MSKIKFWQRVAEHMPRELVYFCAIRLGAFATVGKYGNTIVPDLTFMDALQRWEMKDEQ